MSAEYDFPGSCRRSDGLVIPGELTIALYVTKSELAAAIGLSRDSVCRTSRRASPRTQQRLNELVEIIVRILPWAGHPRIAFSWYRSQPLPSFGGMTPEDLLKSGRSEDVERYLSRIAGVGYT